MTTDPCIETLSSSHENPTGRLVVRYLLDNKNGATASQILEYLRVKMNTDSRNLDKIVESILESGTALGFLERKGSHYKHWTPNQLCGMRRRRRRRSCSRRRRRRRIRRRSCKCRRSRRRRR